jgi:dephospho-CoA kinase
MEVQKSRLVQRDNITLEQAEARVNAQMNIEEKKRYDAYDLNSLLIISHCNLIVDNSGSVDHLPALAREIFQHMNSVNSYNRLTVFLTFGVIAAVLIKKIFF